MREFFQKYQIGIYLVVVLIISWIPWFMGTGGLLTAAPFLLAIIFAFAINGRDAGMDLLRRATRWRANIRWWLVAFLGTAVLFLIGLAMHLLLGGRPPTMTALREEIALVPLFLLIVLMPFNGPVGEEIGWRGYLQGRLQPNLGPVWTSLIIGAYWGFWHLPDFLIPDTLQSSLGMVFFVPFILSTIANSLIMTWLYNKTGQSTLIAGIIWHAGTDFWGPLLLSDLSLRAAQAGDVAPELDPVLYGIALGILVVAAVVLGFTTRWRFAYSEQAE